MYDGYIIESVAMENLYWEYIGVTYTDEPPEVHQLSPKILTELNTQLKAINVYLREILDDSELELNSFDELMSYLLDNYPSGVSPDILNIYLTSMEDIIMLIGFKFQETIEIIDCVGGVAITLE